MQPVWAEVDRIINFWAADDNESHPVTYEEEWEDFLSVSQPGVFQDPDALVVGNVNDSDTCKPCNPYDPSGGFCGGSNRSVQDVPCMCCGTLSATEEQTNMVMWSMWAAPLEIGADLRSIPAASAAVLQNPEVIAVNQDALVYQGRRVSNSDGLQVWQKRLADGSVAVALYNANDDPAAIPLEFDTVGFTGCDRVVVRDLIRRTDLGTHVGGLHLDAIAGHGAAMLRLTISW
jgi:hypothetical protein